MAPSQAIPPEAAPKHAKAIRHWDGIMANDRSVFDWAFHPDARIFIWFGEGAGRPKTVLEHKNGDWGDNGLLVYKNRRQYFSGNCMIETHTVTWNPESALHGLGDKSCEAMLLLEVDDDGRITRMDELLDPAMCKEPRSAPAPASPPSIIQCFGEHGADDPLNLKVAEELFDKIMAHEDVGHLFAEGAAAAQLMASTKGAFHPIRPNGEGKTLLSQFKGAVVYTNRRRFAGRGFAVEQHTASLQFRPEKVVRHSLEVAVLLRIDEQGKITALEEYMDPSTIRREHTSQL